MTRTDNKSELTIIGVGVVIVLLFLGIYLIGYPQYKIWKLEKEGQAQLAEAGWTKKIKIEEAKADLESASLEKNAMIIRAEGTAQANKIVSGSLDKTYIDYLLANKLVDANTQVVYVPTEGSIPIIEAGRTSTKT